MSLVDDHTAVAAPSGKPWHFKRGNTAYRARQDRIAEKLNALRQTYDATSPGDMALLATAAVHLADADVARSKVALTRATNSALRVLARVPRRAKAQPTAEEVINGVR